MAGRPPSRLLEALRALMAGPASVGALSVKLGVRLDNAYFLMMKLKRLNQVECVGSQYEVNFTRPVKRYQITPAGLARVQAPPVDDDIDDSCTRAERKLTVLRADLQRPPRRRTPSGSGQIAGPCISRSYKWRFA